MPLWCCSLWRAQRRAQLADVQADARRFTRNGIEDELTDAQREIECRARRQSDCDVRAALAHGRLDLQPPSGRGLVEANVGLPWRLAAFLLRLEDVDVAVFGSSNLILADVQAQPQVRGGGGRDVEQRSRLERGGALTGTREDRDQRNG